MQWASFYYTAGGKNVSTVLQLLCKFSKCLQTMGLTEDSQSLSQIAMLSPAFHHEPGKAHRQSTDGSEAPERAGDTKEEEPSAEAGPSLREVDGASSENQYDDLYVFIPGIDSDSNSQEPLPYCRPPLPPPRPGTAASQLERPHFTSQGKFVGSNAKKQFIPRLLHNRWYNMDSVETRSDSKTQGNARILNN